MKREKILFIILALLVTSVVGLGFITIVRTENTPLTLPVTEAKMDLTHEKFVEREQAIRRAAAAGELEVPEFVPSGVPVLVGEEFDFTVSDDGLGVDYDQTFVTTLVGTHGIIMIEKAASDAYGIYGEYRFPNPETYDASSTDPWLREYDVITHDQLVYLLDQFDNNIYSTVAAVFGEPDPRGDEGQKVWILIFNIRDWAYYDPDAEYYTAGYFSSSESITNNKNIMHIDSYNWQDRVGPGVARPYLYEGVFAHEFQHLVHFDQDPDEPSWVDEACAELSSFICGYGVPDGHLMYYMAYHMMTSFTFWGSQLEDYGAAFLMALYYYEHYGGAAFFTKLVSDPANGFEGFANTLAYFGYSETFDQIFDYITLAIYLDSFGKYGYSNLDIGSADTRGWTIEGALDYWGVPIFQSPFDISSDWFYGIEPQPYTAHYHRYNTNGIGKVSFTGEATTGVLPYSGDFEWYSGADAWTWRSFYQTFSIPATGATLEFNTFFDIEGDWDYGYVEVYDQDTGEWYTLDAAGTVDYVAHAQDNPNTPDGREPSAYEAAGRWHAFTGYSGGWVPVSMDLTPFAGHDIDLYFTLWQDGAFTLQNMYIDDISIPEISFFDDVEAGEDGWTSTGWYVFDGIFYNNWGVTTLSIKTTTWWYHTFTTYNINRMSVNTITETGTMYVMPVPSGSGNHVTIVSNRAQHILSSHYGLSVGSFSYW